MESKHEDEADIAQLQYALNLQRTDPIKALAELRGLSERGSLTSMIHVGWSYEKGIGTAIDLNQAEYWYKRASHSGSSHASYRLGLLYHEEGRFSEAIEEFNLGVSQDYMPCIYRLGLMYLKGNGVSVNLDKARALFETASRLGHVYAKRSLATVLLYGGFGPIQMLRGLWLLGFGFVYGMITVIADPTSDRLA